MRQEIFEHHNKMGDNGAALKRHKAWTACYIINIVFQIALIRYAGDEADQFKIMLHVMTTFARETHLLPKFLFNV